MSKGILLDQDNDLKVGSGTALIGDSMVQDAFIALSLNQGELKDDPLTGINLVRMIRGKAKTEKMKKTIEIGLKRVGIKLDDIKGILETSINGDTI